MLLILGVLAAVVLIIVARKREIIVHDPLEGAHQGSGQAADAASILRKFKEGKPGEGLAFIQQIQRELEEAAQQDTDPDAELSPELEDALMELVEKGQVLDAIKLYGEATGADLATSKRAIDRLASGQ